ncbi:MAG: ABC transporter permease [bacterium]
MHGWRLILRALVHHRRTHLGIGAGVAVAAAILVGALAVGDSLRASLEEQALRRVGRVRWAMHTGDRPFTDELAARLSEALATSDEPATAALSIEGVAIADGGRRRAPEVRVLGIDPSFWALGGVAPRGPRAADGAVINRELAAALAVAAGDELLLRVAKPSALPRDVPLASDDEASVTLRVTVEEVIDGASFGDFDLAAAPTAPRNVFVDRRLLQRRVGLVGRSNLVLVAGDVARTALVSGGSASAPSGTVVPEALARGWRLEDAGARLRRLAPEGPWDLASDRVFLADALADAAQRAAPSRAASTYFVSSIEAANGKLTRYAMVTAYDPAAEPQAPPAPVPATLAPDEIVVTRWLAAQLAVSVGDPLTLRYWVFDLSRRLREAVATFRVAAVVEDEAPGGDRDLMPDLPGLTDVASPLDWAPAPELGVRVERISAAETAYWHAHRGAPKAFVSAAWARRDGAWRTPYGDVTSVRLAAGVAEASLREAIRERIGDPARLGLGFAPVRELALGASRQGVASYFGYLFVGLSIFVIVAAITLIALLFSFHVEQRTDEIGTLLALGFRPAGVARLFVGEGLAVAVVGALVGLPAGGLYAAAMLAALSGRWAEAVARTPLTFHVAPATPVLGLVATVVVATIAMARVLKHRLRLDAHTLMSARFGSFESAGMSRRRARVVAAACATAAVVLASRGLGADAAGATGFFFGAGTLMLLASLYAAAAFLRPPDRIHSRPITFLALGRLSGGRRLTRSLATLGMLASGMFLVVAVNAFRQGDDSTIGTGGFAMFARTSIPVAHDLGSAAGVARLGLDAFPGVRFLPFRLRDGDEASCRNLNQPKRPLVLGVDAAAIQARNPFRFARTLTPVSQPWSLLARQDEPDVVPGVVDDAVAQWVLKVGLGDTLAYVDEAGRPFRIRIVGTLASSILQGYVVIDARAFAARFPSIAGNRVFLVDLPSAEYAAFDRRLKESALEDYGLTTVPASERLAAFEAVQNTYLSIFSVVGGLGLVLGCLGLALVVLRNVLERRAELAILLAVGFSKGRVRRLVLLEHVGLLVLGATLGIVAAVVAVGPAAIERGRLPLDFLLGTAVAVIANGLVATIAATALALRGELVPALRRE